MEIKGPAKMLKIYVGESDRWRGKPLANELVLRLRKEGIAGATVLRGVEGFGANSRIHRRRFCGPPKICLSWLRWWIVQTVSRRYSLSSTRW
jgi:uncharacterized protein DUF190